MKLFVATEGRRFLRASSTPLPPCSGAIDKTPPVVLGWGRSNSWAIAICGFHAAHGRCMHIKTSLEKICSPRASRQAPFLCRIVLCVRRQVPFLCRIALCVRRQVPFLCRIALCVRRQVPFLRRIALCKQLLRRYRHSAHFSEMPFFLVSPREMVG